MDEHSLYLFISIVIMTLTTYAMRAIPIIVFRKKITNRFLRSFLFYVPYAVLSAMAFPAIFTATGELIPSLIGSGVCLVLAFAYGNLLICACGAAISAFIAGLFF